MGNNNYQPQLATPISRRAAAVTPSDTVDLSEFAARGLYIGVAGDVKVDILESGTGITFKSVPVGFLAVSVRRVYSTGTTATNIVALA
jgi:hypothetical protein